MQYLQAAIACVGVLAAVVVFVGVVMPRPFNGSRTVIVVDGIALIAGFVAIVVLPPLLTRSIVWGAVIALAAAPVYVAGVVVGSIWARYLVAWARCGHRPAVATDFAASYMYMVPGDPNYGPHVFDSRYPCSAEAAEAAGYHRTSLR
jgi:hypothetical protein